MFQKTIPTNCVRSGFFDKETQRTFVFLKNNMDLTASQVTLLYKNRWLIELFFKGIKQHLKIKSFWGTSENAVRIQIYTAIISYCLVAIVRQELKIDRSTYEILQVLGISLIDKTPIDKTPVKELFANTDYNDFKELNSNQLSLNLF